MKKFLMLMMVAMGAATMVACSDDENDGQNEGWQNVPENTLIYNGQESYKMVPVVDYYHSEMTLVNAASEATEDDQPVIALERLHILPQSWNTTIDLANPAEGALWSFAVSGALVNFNSDGSCFDGETHFFGSIEEETYQNESIFSSGTLSIKGANDGTPITVLLDCTLKNGKSLKMKIVTDSYEVSE